MTFLKPKLIEVLTEIKKENTCQLLHDTLIPLLNIISNPEIEKGLSTWNVGFTHIPDVNQLFINDNYFNVFTPTAAVFLKQLQSLFQISSTTRKQTNLLADMIEEIEKIVNQTTNRKNNAFLKSFFKYDSSKRFLYDYIFNTIALHSNEKYTFKITKFSINLAENLLYFIIAQVPLLNTIINSFDPYHRNNISSINIKLINNFIEMIFNNDSNSKVQIFEEFDILDENLQDYICIFFRDKLYIHGYQNTIYNDSIKNVVILHSHKIERILNVNSQHQTYVNLGYSLVELLTNVGAFIQTDSTDIKLTMNTKILKLSDKLMENLLCQPNNTEPLLTEQSLYNRPVNELPHRLVHTNYRINIKIKDNNYIHKDPLLTKLSVDVDSLTKFLQKMNQGFNEQELLSLYDIEPFKIKKLREIGGYCPEIINHILQIAQDFNNYTTNQRVIDDIKKTVEKIKKLHKEDNAIFNSQTSSDMVYHYNNYNEYKDVIFEIIDKTVQRKGLLIACLKECLRYSIYKYFVVLSFIDSRGRRYLDGTSLNINTNPYAKIFVKLYNENIEEEPSYEELKIIQNSFTFEQTKLKVSCSSNKNEYNNKQMIFKYIKSYLHVEENKIKSWIQDSEYYFKQQILLDDIYTKLKKKKNLFYVHSLICFEQLCFREENTAHLCNYIRIDASSSGTQMMSILFRDENLGRMSNLIGKENYDFYDKARDYNYQTYMKITTFIRNELTHLKWSPLIQEHMPITFKTYTQEDLSHVGEWGSRDKHLAAMFFSVNINKSSILPKLLKELKNTMRNRNIIIDYNMITLILKYLPSSITKLIDNLNSLDEFNSNRRELEYLFCLRYCCRLINFMEIHIGLNPGDKTSLWFSRDLTKGHVMTFLYMSTPYGRKEAYIDLIHERYLLGHTVNGVLNEITNFFEKTTSDFVSRETDLNIITDFLKDVCHNEKVIISNKYFIITMDPKKTESIQVPCSSYNKKRGPQLVIKKYLPEIDSEKLRSMLMANLAHSMDSSIAHTLINLCNQINQKLKDKGYSFRLICETNHDCFMLNYPVLLPILIEEAYLFVAEQNHIEYIEGLSPNIIDKYVKLTKEQYLRLLNPINPHFAK